MVLSPQQARVLTSLRKVVNGVIGAIPKDEDRRSAVLVANKAEDIELLLDLVDSLTEHYPPA